MDSDAQMTVRDAAKVLDLTPQWVRQLADSGALPSTRTVGGFRLFRARDVTRFKRQRDAEKREAAAQR
jgi:excisionase family DNA binding protein